MHMGQPHFIRTSGAARQSHLRQSQLGGLGGVGWWCHFAFLNHSSLHLRNMAVRDQITSPSSKEFHEPLLGMVYEQEAW